MSTDGDLVDAVADGLLDRGDAAGHGRQPAPTCRASSRASSTPATPTVAVTGTFDSRDVHRRRAAADRARPVRRRHRRAGDGDLARRVARRAVVRRPHPAAGRRAPRTRWGFPLSSVSSAGADAPPLPAELGLGQARRLRAPAASGSGRSTRTSRSSARGSCRAASTATSSPAFHEVYSRSEQSTAWNGRAILPLMIRYQKTDIGAIGFHGIPIHVTDGTAYRPRPSSAPASPVAASARPTPTPRSCGRSRRSARRSSSSDRRSPAAADAVHTAGTVPSHRPAHDRCMHIDLPFVVAAPGAPQPRRSDRPLLRRAARRDPLVRPQGRPARRGRRRPRPPARRRRSGAAPRRRPRRRADRRGPHRRRRPPAAPSCSSPWPRRGAGRASRSPLGQAVVARAHASGIERVVLRTSYRSAELRDSAPSSGSGSSTSAAVASTSCASLTPDRQTAVTAHRRSGRRAGVVVALHEVGVVEEHLQRPERRRRAARSSRRRSPRRRRPGRCARTPSRGPAA